MKTKQIGITLEQIKETQLQQRHEPGGSLRTETVDLPTQYEIAKLRNACVIDWNGAKLRVSDRISEAQADDLARCKCFDVTITK